jgi:predicted dehydrogenase
MFRVGIIGYGYWGPNLVRNFSGIDGVSVGMICDSNSSALDRARKAYREVKLVADPVEVLRSPVLDAVAIVTPVWTHHELAKEALQNGKHVLVEKPFTSNSAQAEELIELAERKNLTIMVDHTFLFTGAVRKMRQLINDGELGSLYYYDSTRVNLGLFQHDVNVIWDLAPHDLAIMNYLLGAEPEAVVATGQSHLNGHEDVAYMTIYFPEKLIAHVNVNWLSPVKVRMTLIGGEKKMLVWNDLNADEKVKIYDRGVDIQNNESVYNLLVSYRSGDVVSPKLDGTEALKLELQHFVDCIQGGLKPINDGVSGLKVVRLLEAADASIRNRGKLVQLATGNLAGVATRPHGSRAWL